MENRKPMVEFLKQSLNARFEDAELKSIAKLILEDNRSTNMVWLKEVVTRLNQSEPIQYILGYAWFYDLKLAVNKYVIVPRQETEELVDWIIKDAPIEGGLSILDIGTGSGCISLALANHIEGAKILSTDVSQQALELAKSNAKTTKVANIKFLKDDILQSRLNAGRFDVIVSNPPYIKQSDKKLLAKNVLDYEPHVALFVKGKYPLLFYKTIAKFAKDHLEKTGKLYYEVNEFTAEELKVWMEKENWQVELRKDLNGNWRMLKAQLAN